MPNSAFEYPAAVNAFVTVCSEAGLQIRAGAAMDTEKVVLLPRGAVVQVYDEAPAVLAGSRARMPVGPVLAPQLGKAPADGAGPKLPRAWTEDEVPLGWCSDKPELVMHIGGAGEILTHTAPPGAPL